MNNLGRNKVDFAIVAMSVRAPGANKLSDFWKDIVSMKECVSIETQSKSELSTMVMSRGRIDDLFSFDNRKYGISDAEAEKLSVKYKKMIEMTRELLGFTNNLDREEALPCSVYIANEGDVLSKENQTSALDFDKYISRGNEFISTRLSYIFNFSGESIDVLSACSSSLVAIELACQSLLFGDNKYSIAGGCNIHLPQEEGYTYYEGMIYSKSGHCCPFSSNSDGTVESNGIGLVMIKRLEDAIEDGDYIYAVIKGFSMNNDASDKMSYTSPGITGQKQVINKAIDRADIPIDDLVYIETHGTATSVGDAIEYNVLSDTYGNLTKNPIYLGSVKANIGHTIRAAGVLSLIKTALVLNKGIIPGMCNFKEISPLITKVNKNLIIPESSFVYDNGLYDKYAGVSSFGIGGTNAHFILKGFKNKVEKLDDDSVNNTNVEKQICEEIDNENDSLRTNIVKILRKYLLVEHMEDDIDLYSSGMDSMVLLSFISECEEVTQMQYDLMDVVELSTVKELLDYICENS